MLLLLLFQHCCFRGRYYYSIAASLEPTTTTIQKVKIQTQNITDKRRAPLRPTVAEGTQGGAILYLHDSMLL